MVNANARHFPIYSTAQQTGVSVLPSPYLGLASEPQVHHQALSEHHGNPLLNPNLVSRTPDEFLPVLGVTLNPNEPPIHPCKYAMPPLHAGNASLGAAGQQQNEGDSGSVNRHEEELLFRINPYHAPVNFQQSEAQQVRPTGSDAINIHTPVPRSRREKIPETLERQLQEVEDNGNVVQGRLQGNNSLAQPQTSISARSTVHTRSPGPTSNLQDANISPESRVFPPQQFGSRRAASSLNALAPEFQAGTAVSSFGSSVAGTIMRPTAPAFHPAAAFQVAPASREFNFSSSGPRFGSSSMKVAPNCHHVELPNGGSEGIFSAVQYPVIPKAVKKSRAVAIQRPRVEQPNVGPESEVQEDESGRITQAEGRQKRVRRSCRDGEQRPSSGASAQEQSSTDERYDNADTVQAMIGDRRDHIRQDSVSVKKAAQAAVQLEEIIDDLSASEGFGSQHHVGEAANSERTASSSQLDPNVTAPAPRISLGEMDICHGRLAEEQSASCGSKPNEAPISIASNPAEDTNLMQETPTPADSNTLEILRRKELLTPSVPSSDTRAEHPRNQSPVESAFDSGKVNEPGTQETFEVILDGVTYVEPPYEEINALVEHLDGEKPRQGVKGNDSSYGAQNADGTNAVDFHNETHRSTGKTSPSLHSDAPKTSPPRGAARAYQYSPPTGSESADSSIVKLVADNARFSPSYRPSLIPGADPAAVDGLRSADSAAISEWGKTSSSSDEPRRHGRRTFLDSRVHSVVGDILQERLAPLERSLSAIKSSLVGISKLSSGRADRPRSSDNAGSSDADDEGDVETNSSRTKSPLRHRDLDKVAGLVTQLPAAQQGTVPLTELAGITEDIRALKQTYEETRPSFIDVKTVVEEAIAKQLRGRSVPITSSHQSATAEKNQLQIDGLESMLKVAEGRAEDELKARRATEDALADSQRLLRLALQDAAEQRESAEETERSLSVFHEERHDALRRNAMLEGAQESLQNSVSELTEKAVALEATLEEYRLSSAQWRSEIESTKVENGNLRRTLTALKNEIEDGMRNRQALRAKFDQLQDEMAHVSQDIARDRSLWLAKEEELETGCKGHVADYVRERQRCDKLEVELAAVSDRLRCDKEKQYQVAAQYERELYDQREVTRLERERLQRTMDDQSAAATNKLNMMRTEFESVITSLESRLDRAEEAASAEKEKHGMILQEAIASKATALQEHQTFHEQVVKGLTEQREQVSQSVARERQSIELQNKDRLALADEKLLHYQDIIRHLEERVEIAKLAAQAAVQSKQAASKVPNKLGSSLSDELPEKISPQALRESILVLQEQLQDRESRIELVEQKLCAVDVDAPKKIKVQEAEISWLRELLGVRIDELENLITALAQPACDREAIKDAAIRLKANLEMEQQEKERAHSGGPLTAQFPSLSTLTTSPRTFPLAAAAAWGNWRKGWKAPMPDALRFPNIHATDTPSRSSPSAQSVLSGLLTPPSTKRRGTGQSSAALETPARLSAGRRPATSIRGQSVSSSGDHQSYGDVSPPVTPSLTRKANYDMDATAADVREVQDDMGIWTEAGQEEPFGPPLAAFTGAV